VANRSCQHQPGSIVLGSSAEPGEHAAAGRPRFHRFLLASEGQDYVVYSRRQEEIRIRELRTGQKYRCEWFDSLQGSVRALDRVTAEASTLLLQPPCAGAVLFLEREDK
jgi:hypothetical protein